MGSRRLLALLGMTVLMALAGCVGEPPEQRPVVTPTPAYTPGVDPEADVAAAIETYEAYVEASNNLVLADRETWDPVLDLLLEDYRKSSVLSYEQMAENGEVFDGPGKIVSAELEQAYGTVLRIHVCTDFSAALIRDAHGDLIGDISEYGVLSMNVVLQAAEPSPHGWKIGYFGMSDRPCL
ncbi:hypothetical protein GCM10009860_10640 [Microbacterium mitrae]|uniref:Nuclear transport factor 2 family protein n=1 Tax=Microbacterium mitrae TaxID=664640 RepID=A0A5C8HQK3_9MICO|nr:hypothetical protein [Microbacterium mitrae]TXK06396.1 hypothetical protein FVP60_05420 [Microbacterium mitrae]